MNSRQHDQNVFDLSFVLYVKKLLEYSHKSSIFELCEWIGANKTIGNPFEGCTKKEFNAHMNYSAERCV